MTNFDRGAPVQPRDYVAKRYPRYADQVGRYEGYRSVGRKHLLTITWPDQSVTEWPASYVKQARGQRAQDALRTIAANVARNVDRDAFDYEEQHQAPTGDVLPPAGFKPPEQFSDDVRAGRVTLGETVVVSGAQVTMVPLEGDEVVDQPPIPAEPTYGPCNGYRCGCDDWNPGRKVGGLQVCATCTHTQNTHKVPTQARVARRGNV